MRHALCLPLAVPLLLLAACAETPTPQPVVTTGMPNPELALQTALDNTTREMGKLGSLRPAAPAITPDPALPDDLKRRLWFVWNGPLEPAIRSLGKQIGYTVVSVGHRQDIAVQTNTVAPVIEQLRSLGDQAGSAASVVVDPLSHSITVTYNG